MMKKKNLIAMLMAGVMLVGLLSGCGGKDSGSTPSDGGNPDSSTTDNGGSSGESGTYARKTAEGTLTVGLTDTADSFDPSVSFNSVGIQLVYDQILIKDPYTGEITS